MHWTSNLHFFIKENWICTMTRHHVESIIDKISSCCLLCQTVKPCFNDTIALFVGTMSNNRTCGQFECDMTWLCFCFDFVR